MSDYTSFTMVRDGVHNASEPRHFMRIKPVAGRVQVLRDGVLLASSDNAVRVLEVARDLYDPVFYFPREDVVATLAPTDQTNHCPIKGDGRHYRVNDSDGAAAWSYEATRDDASELAGRVAFYSGTFELRISATR